MTKQSWGYNFSWCNWGISDLLRAADGILDQKRKVIEGIKKIPKEKRNFNNTLLALEESDYYLSDRFHKIEFLMHVSPDKRVRDKVQELSIQIRQEMLALEFDRDIYRALTELKNNRPKLKGASKKLFDDYLKSYRRRGFELPLKEFEELMVLRKRLTELSTVFEKNINEYEDYIEISIRDAKDLPVSYVNTLKRRGTKYLVGLSYPEYFPFMEYCSSSTKREELSQKFFRKGGEKNLEIMKEILDIRFKISSMLGYKNFASYAIEMKMAKSPDTASRFLKELEKRVSKAAKKDIKDLETLKIELTSNKKSKLDFHDLGYYSRILKERRFNLNKEEIKKHFQFDKVKEGVFDVYSHLLSIRFKKISIKSWHEDVEGYEVIDNSGKPIGYFLMDMFPRKGKYGHAAAFDIISGRREAGEYIKPVSVLVMNVPKPTTTQPSLLTHGEVETFFHEFGHIMQMTLTKAQYLSQSGASVAWDFVEAPSQILENWAWQKQVFKMITSHVDTQKAMGDELIDKIVSSKNFFEAYGITRQLVFAQFDLDIHTQKPQSIRRTFDSYQSRLTGLKLPKGSLFPASFGHFTGYEAGYYGYLWSKVFAEDMFSVFQKKGVLNKRIGKKYRREILEVGSSRDEKKSVERFLGRRSSPAAFFKALGI